MKTVGPTLDYRTAAAVDQNGGTSNLRWRIPIRIAQVLIVAAFVLAILVEVQNVRAANDPFRPRFGPTETNFGRRYILERVYSPQQLSRYDALHNATLLACANYLLMPAIFVCCVIAAPFTRTRRQVMQLLLLFALLGVLVTAAGWRHYVDVLTD